METSYQKFLLAIPLMVLLSTAYVACSSEDDLTVYPLNTNLDPDSSVIDSTVGDFAVWPEAAIEDASPDIEDADSEDDAPISGGG